MKTLVIFFFIACLVSTHSARIRKKRSDGFVRERIPPPAVNTKNENPDTIVREKDGINAKDIENKDKTNKEKENFVRTAIPGDETDKTPLPNAGTFWHITDIHLDTFYNLYAENPSSVCPSSNGEAVINPGPFGDYRCDAPFKLVNSSIYAMQKINPNPDFIIWTGDDTLHTNEENILLNETLVLETIKTITRLIMEAFPHTVVYPALGNHDYHPKNQVPADCSTTFCPLLDGIANLWEQWLGSEHIVFRDSGYYATNNKKNTKLQVVVLNTNLWYSSNKLINNTIEQDPGGQFKFLESILERAVDDQVKIFIIGHIPPGYFELVDYKYWLYQNYNNRYIEIVKKYSHVIAGQFFGHHHTDSFRVFEHNGRSVSTAFIAPGVSPWMTSLPGVKNGANNPAIRQFFYDEETLELQDYVQYYLNLDKANSDNEDVWEIEYRATEAFDLQSIDVSQMEYVYKRLKDANLSCDTCEDYGLVQKFSLYNSVSFNTDKCGEECRNKHVCAIGELQQEGYNACTFNRASSFNFNLMSVLLITLLVSYSTNWNC